MSSRYTLTAPTDILAIRFGVDATDSYKPRHNVSPAQLMPVMTMESPNGFSFFYWGFISKWANSKSISERLYTTRAEQINEKISLKSTLMERRCIIPADGFYEWKKVSKKGRVPYYFYEKDHQPFSIAGLWEEFEDDEGEQQHSFSMLTCAANQLIADCSDRMPAILDKSFEKKWLESKTTFDELIEMLKPFPASGMQRHSVSPKVNDEQVEGPELISPSAPSDQYGNYTLFD